MKKLIELRKKIKSKKPEFVRQDAHKKPKLGWKWRKPRGLHSKVRMGKKGYRRKPAQGYGSPKAVAGLHKSGLKPIRIFNLNDLAKVKPDKEGAVIAQSVGKKNKIELIKKAEESGIKVLNIKDTKKYLEKIKEEKEKQKKKKAERLEKKKKSKGKEKTKEKEKTKKEEGKTDEEKKEEAKREKDKILTKKE